MLTSGVSDWFNVTSNSNVYGAPPVPLGRDHLGAIIFLPRNPQKPTSEARSRRIPYFGLAHFWEFGRNCADLPNCPADADGLLQPCRPLAVYWTLQSAM